MSPDPYVQAPDYSQNYNRYTYALNNPLKYTDPSGEIFWIPFAIGFAVGYATHGISSGNWGIPALASGVMGGLSFSSYTGAYLNSVGIFEFQLGVIFGTYAASVAVNTATNQMIPAQTMPIGNFGVSMSPAFGFGTNGLSYGSKCKRIIFKWRF